MVLGTEQLRDGKVKSVMKWYGAEGDCAPKDKIFKASLFPRMRTQVSMEMKP